MFLCLSCVILILLDICITFQFRHSSKQEYAGWNDIFDHKISVDVIVMGSSRAWVQYSPRIIDSLLHIKSYNFGIDGSSFNRQYVKYQMYRKYNNKPKFIIQNIDYNSTLGWTEGYQKHQYFPFLYNKDVRTLVIKTEPFSFKEKYIPMYRYSHCGIRNMNFGPGPHYKGYMGLERDWDGRKYMETDTIFFKSDARTLNMFAGFLDETKKEGIKVIMVYAPLYYGAREKIVNIDRMYSVFDSLSKLYDVPILDYNFDEICYDTLLFYNAMHLNKKGSELFTTKLCHDIDSLQLLN